MTKSNTTCGLSDLAIQAGDDIVFFVLEDTGARNESTNDFSYATAYYRPVGIPIYGQANTNSGIDNIKTNGRWMSELLTNDPQFKYVLNDGADITPKSTRELLNDVIALGASNYSVMIVRKDILDKLKDRNASNFAKYTPAFTEFRQAYSTHATQWLDKDGDLTDLFADTAIQKTIRDQNLFTNTIDRQKFPSLKFFMGIACMATHESIQEGIIDVLYVTELLSNLNKFWTPQVVRIKTL